MEEETITAEGLQGMLDAKQPVTVLDVRQARDRAEWWIPGSLHADAYKALWRGDERALDAVQVPPGPPVVAVCYEGKTSVIAAALLRRRGLTAVSLEGGMRAWSLAWNVATVPLTGIGAEVVQVRRTGKGCLSYLISADQEAVVVDPSLPAEVYLNLATQRGWTVSAVLETHVHADHLSRARALADQSRATLYLPDQERVSYAFKALRDGDTVDVGRARLTVISTPGHTPESTVYLLEGRVLFTGDTLFLAGVGRPDLAADADETRRRAHALHGSLRRILGLPGETLILPAHTSQPIDFDGRPIMATLSEVRQRVELLHAPEATFVKSLLRRIPEPPPNHERIVSLNEAGLFPEEDVTVLEAGANRCAVG
jgi:glyoxylase-like metal-dependent hydrolase (beta-lactamase superfamily II)/rhodanese-related sulfurtransferase